MFYELTFDHQTISFIKNIKTKGSRHQPLSIRKKYLLWKRIIKKCSDCTEPEIFSQNFCNKMIFELSKQNNLWLKWKKCSILNEKGLPKIAEMKLNLKNRTKHVQHQPFGFDHWAASRWERATIMTFDVLK